MYIVVLDDSKGRVDARVPIVFIYFVFCLYISWRACVGVTYYMECMCGVGCCFNFINRCARFDAHNPRSDASCYEYIKKPTENAGTLGALYSLSRVVEPYI